MAERTKQEKCWKLGSTSMVCDGATPKLRNVRELVTLRLIAHENKNGSCPTRTVLKNKSARISGMAAAASHSKAGRSATF